MHTADAGLEVRVPVKAGDHEVGVSFVGRIWEPEGVWQPPQTGFGRTGLMFAMEHYGIEPDLIVIAKSIAAGVPLSGVVGRAEMMDAPHLGAIGGTYIGNPLALAAALAVLDVFAEDDLLQRARGIGDRIRDRMLAWQQRWPQIGDVRGLGAMLAIELVEDREQKAPATALAQRTIDRARSNGLLLLTCGAHKNVVRFLMPLVATTADIDNGLRLLERSLLESAA
jgi:4-aminobutyrate aminotransferase/(S)-3-amino-2-methylpropionate transaminase